MITPKESRTHLHSATGGSKYTWQGLWEGRSWIPVNWNGKVLNYYCDRLQSTSRNDAQTGNRNRK